MVVHIQQQAQLQYVNMSQNNENLESKIKKLRGKTRNVICFVKQMLRVSKWSTFSIFFNFQQLLSYTIHQTS